MILASLDCILATLVVALDISLAYDKVATITIMVVATPGVLSVLHTCEDYDCGEVHWVSNQYKQPSIRTLCHH